MISRKAVLRSTLRARDSSNDRPFPKRLIDDPFLSSSLSSSSEEVEEDESETDGSLPVVVVVVLLVVSFMVTLFGYSNADRRKIPVAQDESGGRDTGATNKTFSTGDQRQKIGPT